MLTKDVAVDCATLREAIIFELRIDETRLSVHLGWKPRVAAIARFASDRFAFDAVTRRDFVVIGVAQTIPDRLGGIGIIKMSGHR
jgi:hypothetical protein